jgi:hypothetical protein
MATVREVSGWRVLVAEESGPVLREARDVLDLIAEGMAADARMIAVPVSGLDPSFFQLRSGFAGEVLQKLVNYRFKLAILGDISAYTEASTAFRDLVREANRGNDVLFLPDIAALTERLATMADAR